MNELTGGVSPPEEAAGGTTAPGRARPADLGFTRSELAEILNLYGMMVARGEWRDYAMDFAPSRAVFSVFRRSSETPLYQIVKDRGAAKRQGAYSVISAGGLVLKRGHELPRVLSVLRPKPRLVVV